MPLSDNGTVTSNGELPSRRFQRIVPGETVAAAIMTVLALPLTVIGLLQAPPEPLSPAQIARIHLGHSGVALCRSS